MDMFWKAASGILITVIFGLTLEKREKDISIIVSLAACCMVSTAALLYLEPILSFLLELNSMVELQDGFLGILLKAVGIALVSELAAAICVDAGNGSLGKTMQLLASTVILYLSIPIFSALLTLIKDIMGAL